MRGVASASEFDHARRVQRTVSDAAGPVFSTSSSILFRIYVYHQDEMLIFTSVCLLNDIAIMYVWSSLPYKARAIVKIMLLLLFKPSSHRQCRQL